MRATNKFMARPPFTIFHSVNRAFRTEDAARAFFTDLRWRDGKFCPYCGHRRVYSLQNGKTHKCASCRKCFTITVGTIFEGTKLPLQTWLFVIAHLCDQGGRVGSTALANSFGLSQKTAWYMLERLRQASLTLSFQKPLRDQKTSRNRQTTDLSVEELGERARAALKRKRTKLRSPQSDWLVFSGDKAEIRAVESVLNKLHAARRLGGGMGYAGDAARIKTLFTPLISRGLEVNSRACYRWALENGWEEDSAAELQEEIQKLATAL